MEHKEINLPYEEALNRAGFSRYNIWIVAVCACITFTMTLEMNSGAYISVASACELGTTESQQGLIESIPMLFIFLTTHFLGYMADTKGRQRVLMITLFISSISGTVATFSPHWVVLIMLKCLASATVGTAMMISLILLSECTPAKHRSSLVILIFTSFLMAPGVMAATAKAILPLEFSFHIPVLNIYFNSWRLLNLLFALPSAVSAILVKFTYESPKYLLCAGRDKEALEVLKKIYTSNTRNDAGFYMVESIELEEVQVSPSNKGFFKSVLERTLPMVRVPVRRYFNVMSGLYIVGYATVYAFLITLPTILDAVMKSAGSEERLTICDMIRIYNNHTSAHENTEVCPVATDALNLVFGVTMILALYNVFISGMTYCVSKKTLFIGIQFVAGLAGLLVNTSPFLILSSVMFMIFMSAIVNIGVVNSYSVDVFPTFYKASAVALTPMGGRGNAMMAVSIIKRLLNNNCELAFYIFGAIAFAGGLLGLLLPSEQLMREHKLKLKPEDSHEEDSS